MVQLTNDEATTKAVDGRTRRRERGRDRVYKAAIALFIDGGYEQTAMSTIAEEAGVSRASVFNYFPTKTAFLDEWTRRRKADTFPLVESELNAASSIRERLVIYMTAVAEMNLAAKDETFALFTAWIRAHDTRVSPQIVTDIADYVRRAQEEGEVRASIGAEHIGVMVAASYGGIVGQWIERRGDFDLRKGLIDIVDVVLDGIR